MKAPYKVLILILVIGIGVFELSSFLNPQSKSPTFPGALRETIHTTVSDSTAPFQLKTTEIPFQSKYTVIQSGFAYLDHPVLRDETRLTFSPDGTRAAFIVHEEKGDYVFIDNTTVGPFRAVSNLVFSPDSSRLLFVVGNLTQGGSFGDINPIGSINYVKLVSDAEHFLASPPLQANQKTYGGSNYAPSDFNLNVNDDYRKLFQSVTSSIGSKAEIHIISPSACNGPCISPPKRQLIVTDYNGHKYEHQPITDSPQYDDTFSNIIFSPDGKKVAYIVGHSPLADQTGRYGALVMVSNIDGSNLTRGELYDSVADQSIRFTPDGKYIAYGAHVGGKIYWVVEKL